MQANIFFTIFCGLSFLWREVVITALHVDSKYLCPPLFSQEEKVATLRNFHNNIAPLFFWHICGSSGVSFCELMKHEYESAKEAFFVKSPDCSDDDFRKAIVTNFSAWESYRREKYLLVSSDFSNIQDFPVAYHKDETTQILLNETYGQQHRDAWSNMVHVLVIRHPLERAISAFNHQPSESGLFLSHLLRG